MISTAYILNEPVPKLKVPVGYLFILLFAGIPMIPVMPHHPVSGLISYALYLIPVGIAFVGLPFVVQRIGKVHLLMASAVSLLFLNLTLLSLFLDGSRIITADLFELYKPVGILIVFLFAAGIDWTEKNLRQFFWSSIFLLLTASVLLGAVEITRSNTLGFLIDMYVRDKGVFVGKPIAFFNTTYFSATVYILLGSLCIARYFIFRKHRYLVMALSAAALLIFTQSRVGFVALFFVMSYALIIYLAINKRKVVPWIGVALTASVAGIMIYYFLNVLLVQFPYLVYGLERYLFGFGDSVSADSGSLAVRYSQVVWAVTENQIAIIGSGIGKGYNRYLESFYALYYYRYGLIGITAYACIWGWAFITCYRGYVKAKKLNLKESASLFLGVNIFIVSLPLMSFASVITDQVHLFPIFYGTLGVIAGTMRTVGRVRRLKCKFVT